MIVDDIDARKTDGFIAIATHGNGVYSAWYNPAAGLVEPVGHAPLQIGNIFPNPVHELAQAEISAGSALEIGVTVYSGTGKQVQPECRYSLKPGRQQVTIRMGNLPAGIYYLVFDDGKEKVTRKAVKL